MGDQFLRRRDVEAELGLSRSEIYRRMELPESDPRHLPRPQRVGARAVRWPASSIEAFKQRQPIAETHRDSP